MNKKLLVLLFTMIIGMCKAESGSYSGIEKLCEGSLQKFCTDYTWIKCSELNEFILEIFQHIEKREDIKQLEDAAKDGKSDILLSLLERKKQKYPEYQKTYKEIYPEYVERMNGTITDLSERCLESNKDISLLKADLEKIEEMINK